MIVIGCPRNPEPDATALLAGAEHDGGSVPLPESGRRRGEGQHSDGYHHTSSSRYDRPKHGGFHPQGSGGHHGGGREKPTDKDAPRGRWYGKNSATAPLTSVHNGQQSIALPPLTVMCAGATSLMRRFLFPATFPSWIQLILQEASLITSTTPQYCT